MANLSLLLALLSLVGVAPAPGDSRAAWSGYAWQKIEIAECVGTGMLTCPPFHEKWDWKRNQWVDIAIHLDPARNVLRLSQRLTDNDPSDRDHVCVTALVVDATGRTLLVHHQNWEIGPSEVIKHSFAYTSSALATAQTIHIGSKQCRLGAGQDDDIHASVLAEIKP